MMKRSLLAVGAALLLLASPLPSQCQGPKSVKISSYGQTCQFFSHHATLTGRYDARICTLTLTLSKATTCCNTFLSMQMLMIGTVSIVPGVPLPFSVRSCVLSLQPIMIFAQPASAGGVWNVPLPPVPGPVTLYLQGVNDYFTTIGLSHDFQTSNGMRIDLL